MKLIFNKFHGTGNDFIIIDNRDKKVSPDNTALFKKLCNRNLGVGADGVILILNHDRYDFEMKYYNSDGREGTMCGNGGRCAYAFALKAGIVNHESAFIASDGSHKAKKEGDIIALSLNDVSPPVIVNGNHFLNTGSPHYIIPVPDISKVNVYEKGKSLRWSDHFAPGGTNVNFVELHENMIKVRTYERGVENETLSCGTGITASAISSRLNSGDGKHIVNVEALGGNLIVSFVLEKKIATSVCLKGAAEFVFEGEIDIRS